MQRNDPILEKKLKDRIQEYRDRMGNWPAVSLEDFFEGNHDLGSIGCNLTKHPGIDTFAARLRALRDLPNVQDVLVGITDFGPESDGIWPFSDWVYILTDLSPKDVADRLQSLQPDDVYYEGAPNTLPVIHIDLPRPKPGFKLLIAWWD